MGKEIERKWLIYNINFDFLKKCHKLYIEQYYTVITDEKEVRYRKIKSCKNTYLKYRRTEKIGKGIQREENEEDILVSDFVLNKNNSLISNYVIKKYRYVTNIKYGGFILQIYIDQYIEPKLDNFLICEIEFKNIEYANNFDPYKLLSFFNITNNDINEVTNDTRFKNKFIYLNKFDKINWDDYKNG